MVKTERTRRREYHGHRQKHIHRINRTKLDLSEERSILCCSIYTSVLQSNRSELPLRKKLSSMKILTSIILKSRKPQISMINDKKKNIL